MVCQNCGATGTKRNAKGQRTNACAGCGTAVPVRHGDLLIRPRIKSPTGAPNKDAVLAYGEATGHKHAVKGEAAKTYGALGAGMLLQVQRSGQVLVHEEHEPGGIELVVGVYEVIPQREWSEVGERRVMD